MQPKTFLLGSGSVMTAAAVLGTPRFAQPTDGIVRRLGTLRFAQHPLCTASYARLATFEAIEPLFFFIEHLNSKRDGYRV